ncbi:MAG TPA: hypothetical protein VKU89_04680 [Solirubrobacteraceae bacterium]|nr:hypothetical protein [Solirubrobacteraceae bacterium]
MVLPIALAVALAASGAFAYFTLTGSGSGEATVGSSSGKISINGTTKGTLYPGAEAVVELTVKNESPGTVYVNQVTLHSITTSASGCKTELGTSSSWFEMGAVTVAKTLNAGESTTATGKLKMINASENQNACQGAKLTLAFESN